MRKNKVNGLNVTIIAVFLFCIYLLCTSFISFFYRGSYVPFTECTAYDFSTNGVINIKNSQFKDSEVIYSVTFDVSETVDSAEIYTEISGLNPDFAVNTSSYVMHSSFEENINSDNSDFDENKKYTASNKYKDLKKGDKIYFKVINENKVPIESELIASITYDSKFLKPSMTYDNTKFTTVQLSAFELLFGSQSSNDLHFSGNVSALIFWLPPIIAVLAFLFDRKTKIKSFIGMLASAVSIAAIVTMVGANRLCLGSTISIILYLVTFMLSAMSFIVRENEKK